MFARQTARLSASSPATQAPGRAAREGAFAAAAQATPPPPAAGASRRALHVRTAIDLSEPTRAAMAVAEPQNEASCFFHAAAMAQAYRVRDPAQVQTIYENRDRAIAARSFGPRPVRPVEKVGGLPQTLLRGPYRPDDIETLFRRHGTLVFKAANITAPGTRFAEGYHAVTLVEIRTMARRRCAVFYDPEAVPTVHEVERQTLRGTCPGETLLAASKVGGQADLFRVVPLDEFCGRLRFGQNATDTILSAMDGTPNGIYRLNPLISGKPT